MGTLLLSYSVTQAGELAPTEGHTLYINVCMVLKGHPLV